MDNKGICASGVVKYKIETTEHRFNKISIIC